MTDDLPRATWELDREQSGIPLADMLIDGVWVALCPACREVLVEIPSTRNVDRRAMAAWAPGDLIPWSETGRRQKPRTFNVPARTPHPATGLPWYIFRTKGHATSRSRAIIGGHPVLLLAPRSRAAERGQVVRLPAVFECACERDCLVDSPPREADTTQVT